MKKLISFVSLLLITYSTQAQVIDENGVEAIGQGNTQLSGNIGVGITNPQLQLHVNNALGLGKFSTSNTEGMRIEYLDSGTSTVNFMQRRWGGWYYFQRGSSSGTKNQVLFGGSESGHRLDIFDGNNDVKIRFNTNANSYYNGTGNFGIGLNNPTAKLDVFGETKSNNYTIRQNEAGITSGISNIWNDALVVGDIGDNDVTTVITGFGGDANARSVIEVGDGEIYFNNEGSNIMHMDDQRVTVGLNQSKNFDVNGNIHANGKITLGGSRAGMRTNGSTVYIGDASGNDVTTYVTGFGEDENASSAIKLGDGEINFRNLGSDVMNINGANVGIGTSSPEEKFHLKFGSLMLEGDGEEFLKVKFKDTDVGDLYEMGVEPGIESFNFTVNDNDHMTIQSTGNVGIGTTAPDSKLAVKGQIHTQEVKVDLEGAVAPDYVFEADYNLITLKQVEEHINEHKHLPEIPSAKQMEKDGVKLKEMNLLLLKKIEELTLYTIEQNKQLKAQKEINKTILQRLKALEDKNN